MIPRKISDENPSAKTANKFQPKTIRGGNKDANSRKLVSKPKGEKSPPTTARECKMPKFSPPDSKNVPVEKIKLPDRIKLQSAMDLEDGAPQVQDMPLEEQKKISDKKKLLMEKTKKL
jgi:hypothetical protein